jgi:hypothetical protein
MLIRPALREYRTWFTDDWHWDLYDPRPGDTIIGIAPKCGTTWMQQIVSSMMFHDERTTAAAITIGIVWAGCRLL